MANKDVKGPEHESSSESGELAEKTIEIRKKYFSFHYRVVIEFDFVSNKNKNSRSLHFVLIRYWNDNFILIIS